MLKGMRAQYRILPRQLKTVIANAAISRRVIEQRSCCQSFVPLMSWSACIWTRLDAVSMTGLGGAYVGVRVPPQSTIAHTTRLSLTNKCGVAATSDSAVLDQQQSHYSIKLPSTADSAQFHTASNVRQFCGDSR